MIFLFRVMLSNDNIYKTPDALSVGKLDLPIPFMLLEDKNIINSLGWQTVYINVLQTKDGESIMGYLKFELPNPCPISIFRFSLYQLNP